jgi:hypothetical protein
LLNSAQSVRGKIELGVGSGAMRFNTYIGDLGFDFRHGRQRRATV